MNKQEYEQKRHDSWISFKTETMFMVDEDAFKAAFDRAYALGKQEKDAEKTVISGWAARDKDGALQLWESMPQRSDITFDEWGMVRGLMLLPTQLFPDLTWESEPLEVEIIIKRKKNGY